MTKKNWKSSKTLPSPRLVPEGKDLKSIINNILNDREVNCGTAMLVAGLLEWLVPAMQDGAWVGHEHPWRAPPTESVFASTLEQ